MADELNWDKNKGVFESIFDATDLVAARRTEVDRKVKLGREKLAGELEQFLEVLTSLSNQVAPTTSIAPANVLKELAANGYVLQKAVHLVVDEAAAKDVSMTLVQGMSSRRLTLEVEENPDKEEFCARLGKCVETLGELVDYFKKPAPVR